MKWTDCSVFAWLQSGRLHGTQPGAPEEGPPAAETEHVRGPRICPQHSHHMVDPSLPTVNVTFRSLLQIADRATEEAAGYDETVHHEDQHHEHMYNGKGGGH